MFIAYWINWAWCLCYHFDAVPSQLSSKLQLL